MSVVEVMEEVEKDHAFYEASGGGMTVSGGEPTTQPNFVEALLRDAQKRGIHTALETCGETQWPILKRLLKFTDLVLYDIKAMDERLHERLVGTSNAQILSNAAKVAMYRPLIVRVPVVPGMNDSEENIRGVASFAGGLKGVKEIHLLAYHRLGESKYPRLSRTYRIQGLAPPSQPLMQELRDIVSSYGFIVRIGG
jgi:pyruvate formate lyase activating enzyme